MKRKLNLDGRVLVVVQFAVYFNRSGGEKFLTGARNDNTVVNLSSRTKREIFPYLHFDTVQHAWFANQTLEPPQPQDSISAFHDFLQP